MSLQTPQHQYLPISPLYFFPGENSDIYVCELLSASKITQTFVYTVKQEIYAVSINVFTV